MNLRTQPVLLFVSAMLCATSLSAATFTGYYKVTARHSGKAVVVQGASTADDANVIQWTYGGTNTNDEWLFTVIGNGYYQIPARHSGKALQVSGAGTADGTAVVQRHSGLRARCTVALTCHMLCAGGDCARPCHRSACPCGRTGPCR